MKRLISAVLSTLVLSALVAPGAKAIRPELLPERVHPTIHTNDAAEPKPGELTQQSIVQTSMQTPHEQKSVEVKPISQSEELPFGFFENYYREHYGD